MTSHQYKRAIKTLGLTQREAANLLGVCHRTSAGYAIGEHPIPKPIAQLVTLHLKMIAQSKIITQPEKTS
jgi:hypothetical protein